MWVANYQRNETVQMESLRKVFDYLKTVDTTVYVYSYNISTIKTIIVAIKYFSNLGTTSLYPIRSAAYPGSFYICVLKECTWQ